MGYVYFAYCPDLYKSGYHHVKIGITINPTKRIMQLQTGNSHKIVFYKLHETENYKELEKQLHNKYAKKHIRGEWFNLKLEELNTEINENETFFTKLKRIFSCF